MLTTTYLFSCSVPHSPGAPHDPVNWGSGRFNLSKRLIASARTFSRALPGLSPEFWIWKKKRQNLSINAEVR